MQHWPRWLIEDYLTAIPGIQAREEIIAFGISAYPHLEDKDRVKLFKTTCQAGGIDYQEEVPETHKIDATTEGGALALGGLGILVVNDDA